MLGERDNHYTTETDGGVYTRSVMQSQHSLFVRDLGQCIIHMIVAYNAPTAIHSYKLYATSRRAVFSRTVIKLGQRGIMPSNNNNNNN